MLLVEFKKKIKVQKKKKSASPLKVLAETAYRLGDMANCSVITLKIIKKNKIGVSMKSVIKKLNLKLISQSTDCTK